MKMNDYKTLALKKSKSITKSDFIILITTPIFNILDSLNSKFLYSNDRIIMVGDSDTIGIPLYVNGLKSESLYISRDGNLSYYLGHHNDNRWQYDCDGYLYSMSRDHYNKKLCVFEII